MEELAERLRLQLVHRPGSWIAVVHDRPERVRATVERLAVGLGVPVVDRPTRPDEVAVWAEDHVPDRITEAVGRIVLVVPVSAGPVPRPPRLACRIGAPPLVHRSLPPPLDAPPPGSVVEPGPLLDRVSADREGLGRLALGAAALVDRGWYADAGPFVERLRFEAYRAAATTWDDRWLLDKVALVEELTGQIALAWGDLRVAWESWRTAWWLRSEVVPGDEARLARAAHHLGALCLARGDDEEARARLEHARSIRERLGDARGVAEVDRTIARGPGIS